MTSTHLNRWSLPWRPVESAATRWFYLIVALIVIGMISTAFMAFWVPANGGVDQNGYMVGGKMFAQHATSKLTPTSPIDGRPDPYLFVGRMWVGTDLGLPTERYYPKYPVGLPILIAIALKLGGPSLAYLISPAGVTLGLLACFLLMRHIVGSFLGLIGMFLVATSPVLFELAIVPNSHGADFFFVSWGMFCLWLWMDHGRFRWAILGGFLLGYSVSIRYTDGLLVLPLVWGVLTAVQWRSLRSRLEAIVLLTAWAVPVLYLVVFNLYTLQSLTGYDPTNESTGFSWTYFCDNWENMFRQLNNGGLFLVFPLGLAGLAILPWWHKRLGGWLWLWVLPTLLLYTAYYWAPGARNNTSYLRFFMSVLPGLSLAAMVVVAHLRHGDRPQLDHSPSAVPATGGSIEAAASAAHRAHVPGHDAWRRWGLSLTVGALAVLAGAMNLRDSVPNLNNQYVGNLSLHEISMKLQKALPADAVLFSRDAQLFHHLQFVTDFELYTTEFYEQRAVKRLADVDTDEPQGLQPQRRLVMYERLKNQDQRSLVKLHESQISALLTAGRKVFLITRTKPMLPPNKRPKTGWEPMQPNFSPSPGEKTFDSRIVASWCTPRTFTPPRARVPRAQRHDDINIRLDPKSNEWCVVQLTLKDHAAEAAKAAREKTAAKKAAADKAAAAKAAADKAIADKAAVEKAAAVPQ